MNKIFHFTPAAAHVTSGEEEAVQKGFLEDNNGERWQVTIIGDKENTANSNLLNKVISTFIQCSSSRSVYQMEYNDLDKSYRIFSEGNVPKTKGDGHFKIVISKAVLPEDEVSDLDKIKVLLGSSKEQGILLASQCLETYIAENNLEGIEVIKSLVKDHSIASTKLLDALSDPSPFGNFSGPLDHHLLKEGVIHTAFRQVDGKPTCCFDFTLDSPAYLESLKLFKLPKECTVQYRQHVFKGPKGDNFTEKAGMEVWGSKDMEITFEGIGKVTIALPSSVQSLTGVVHIEIDDSEHLNREEVVKRLGTLLNTLGLGTLLADQAAAIDEEKQAAQLKKAFNPEPPPAAAMKKEMVLPGMAAWKVEGFGERIRESGGWGLMVGVGGLELNKIDAYKNAAVLLQQGFYSNLTRLQGGLGERGGSCGEDLDSGGALNVYTRAINQHHGETPISRYPFRGTIQFLIDFDAITPDSYANHTDQYGTKSEPRENLISFASGTTSSTNELMIPNHVPARYIRGVVVQSEEDKAALMKVLEQEGVLQDGKILNVPVDQFIHVIPEDQPFTKEIWR